MSKSERRKLFQPIPLSSILDPTYQAPFSKLEQFQVDMDISSKLNGRPQPSVWQKLQSSLISAMSNFVIMSQPIFGSTGSVAAMSHRAVHSMPLVPWKSSSWKPCELLISEEVKDSQATSTSAENLVPEKSLIHSVRSGLQCLRYLATHPLQSSEEDEPKQSARTQTPTRHYIDCRAEINTTLRCPQKPCESMEKVATAPRSAKAEGNIEIFICSSLPTAQDNKSGKDNVSRKCILSSSPTKAMSVPNSPAKCSSSPGMGSSGCIRFESNWPSMNDELSSGSGRANFHAVSLCSSSSNLKAGTVTFSCSSAMSSSPRAMMSSARSRRFQTESESSADSFVEFSASVESTDSFCIVFESTGGCNEDIEDDEEWEDDDDEDDTDEDEDQIFNYSGASDDLFVDGYIFQADGIDLNHPSGDQVDLCGGSTVKPRKKKTVSFDEAHLENIIEFEDDDKSKSCREMYWEMQARDLARFQDRIKRTGDILEPVLDPAHRLNVFQQRFSNVQNN